MALLDGSVDSVSNDSHDVELFSGDNISPMVNFLITNRNKLVQICLEKFKNFNLEEFDIILQSIMKNDYRTALTVSKKTTALILEILDVNKINYYNKNHYVYMD